MCYCSEVNLVKDWLSLQLSFDVNSKNSSLCFPSFSFETSILGIVSRSPGVQVEIFIQMFSDIKEENPKGYWFKSAGFDYEFMRVKSACWNYNVSQHVLKCTVAQPWHEISKRKTLLGAKVGVFIMSSFSSLSSGELARFIPLFVHMRGWSVGVNVVLYTSINTKRALKTWHLSQRRRETTQSILPGLHLGFDPWVIGVGMSLGRGGMKKEANIPLRIGVGLCLGGLRISHSQGSTMRFVLGVCCLIGDPLIVQVDVAGGRMVSQRIPPMTIDVKV